MSKYPQYFKAVDPEEKVFALIVNQTEHSIAVIQYQSAQSRVIFQQVATVDDVKGIIGGVIAPIEATEYEEILFDQFGFNLSQEVLNATTCVGKEHGDKRDDKPEADTPKKAGKEKAPKAAKDDDGKGSAGKAKDTPATSGGDDDKGAASAEDQGQSGASAGTGQSGKSDGNEPKSDQPSGSDKTGAKS